MVQISYCDYLILPNLVELPMLETANIQHNKVVTYNTTAQVFIQIKT